MSDIVRDGLPLGLRFYDTLLKQKRFGYNCRKGVSHKEYQYVDNCNLPPFQIVRNSTYIENIFVTLICVETEEEFDLNTLCPNLIADITIKTIGLYDYITYKSSHVCCSLNVPNGIYYLKVDDMVNDWYSELFQIDYEMEDVETFYRLWTAGQVRTDNGLDLRIWD